MSLSLLVGKTVVKNYHLYFSTKTCVVGTQKNRVTWMFLSASIKC